MELEKNSKMGSAPVGRLMLTLGLPIVLSMMLQAVYNIVDSAFLSNMQEAGEEALTALGLAFPIQLFIIAVGVGTGVGTNALLAKSMGQGNREKANTVVGNAGFLGMIIFIVFLLFGIFGVPAYVYSQNAGNTMNPIVIYGWLGLPEMGVKGAAYATIIGQIVSGIFVFVFHLKLDKEIKNGLSYVRPKVSIIREIYAIGLPAILSQALLTVMTYGMNLILGGIPLLGEKAVTVYGLYCKIQQMIIFAAVGIRDAITPIVSFNYGMKNKKRIRSGIRYGMLFTLILMVLGLMILELTAVPLTRFFSLSDPTYQMCIDCIRIVSLAFPFAGLCIAFQGVFQAIECGIESLAVSLGRQVIFILPVAWLLTARATGDTNASLVWWTFIIGEFLTFLCTVWMYRHAVKKRIGTWEA